MTHLTVYQDQGTSFTILSDRFIDEFMGSANDAQIKIYLYLLRMTKANRSFGISDIADCFNYTEKDVLRALCYWEKQALLSLDFDSSQNLKAVHVLPIPAAEQEHTLSMMQEAPQAEIVTFTPKLAVNNQAPSVSTEAKKPTYSNNDLVAFRENNETAQMIFVAEQYTGKPLSPSDLQTLLYIYDKLGFSADLIDYLIQYCVGRGKKSFSYIQKVAMNWADSNITTIEQAKNHAGKYDKSVYTIMKALGKNNDPTEPEIAFIRKWTDEFGFSVDIILKACERTVLSTDKYRFEYTNGILQKWRDAGIKSVKDIDEIEAKHISKNVIHASGNNNGTGFNNFNQRSYDYKALEKALLSN